MLFSGSQHILLIMVKERKEGKEEKTEGERWKSKSQGANVTRNYQSEQSREVWKWA